MHLEYILIPLPEVPQTGMNGDGLTGGEVRGRREGNGNCAWYVKSIKNIKGK